MRAASGRVLRPLVSRSTWRRWAYLIMGGALLVPYILIALVLIPLAVPDIASGPPLPFALLALAVAGAVMAVTAFIPAVRLVEGTAVKELLGGEVTAYPVGRAGSWDARWRAAGWFVLHIVLGGLVSVLTMVVPPVAVVLFAVPFAQEPSLNLGIARYGFRGGLVDAWTPLVAAALVVGLIYLVAVLGELLARGAPLLLGPSPAERLAEAEHRAQRLAERNRLARELHDSVGHALSVVTIQAGAARRVLDSDRAFVGRALSAIEESARAALTDLDHVLGLLREEATSTTPRPTLTDLDRLLDKTRLAGVEVDSTVAGSIGEVPPAVSREAYRIVQEGLTNALRHAGKVPVTLRLAVRPDRLELEMTNPMGAARGQPPRGGRGLYGMRERVTVLRGDMTAAAEDHRFRVSVRLPLRPAS